VIWYLDTSAFLKLIAEEDESEVLRLRFVSHRSIWSSQLLYTEAVRAAGQLGIAISTVEEALETVTTVLPSASTFFTASQLSPLELRSLDALHLATALELGDDLEGIVAYDYRLIHAARALSIDVVTPS
jgi:predicted nucleic acid-binding protein